MNEPYKTRGIILHSIKYGDRAHIVYVLTEAFGRKSYWVNSARGGKPVISKSKTTLQSLTIIEYIGKGSSKGDFHRFIELSTSYFPENIIFDYTKGVISLFISELIFRMVKSDEQNNILFDYISQSIYALNDLKLGVANFHLYFLLNLTRFLGYYPNENYDDDTFFDLTQGGYVVLRPKHGLYIEKKESRDLYELQKVSLDELDSLKFNRMTRNTLLEALIAYLNYHYGSNTKLSSIDILKEIL